MKLIKRIAPWVLLFWLLPSSFAANLPNPENREVLDARSIPALIQPPGQGPAPSPLRLSSFDIAIIVQVLVIAVLVGTLIGGGLVLVNFGLLSRREQDRIGGRVPSDVGILKEAVWPCLPHQQKYLPATEGDETEEVIQEIYTVTRVSEETSRDQVKKPA